MTETSRGAAGWSAAVRRRGWRPDRQQGLGRRCAARPALPPPRALPAHPCPAPRAPAAPLRSVLVGGDAETSGPAGACSGRPAGCTGSAARVPDISTSPHLHVRAPDAPPHSPRRVAAIFCPPHWLLRALLSFPLVFLSHGEDDVCPSVRLSVERAREFKIQLQ